MAFFFCFIFNISNKTECHLYTLTSRLGIKLNLFWSDSFQVISGNFLLPDCVYLFPFRFWSESGQTSDQRFQTCAPPICQVSLLSAGTKILLPDQTSKSVPAKLLADVSLSRGMDGMGWGMGWKWCVGVALHVWQEEADVFTFIHQFSYWLVLLFSQSQIKTHTNGWKQCLF